MEEISNGKGNPGISRQKVENYEISVRNKNSQQESPSNIDNMQRSSSDQILSNENQGPGNSPNSHSSTLNRVIWTPLTSKSQGRKSKSVQYYFMLVITNITLEPAEFLWSLGGNMGMASFSQLLVDKSCNDRGYNETICDNVYDYDDIYKEVQKDVIILSIHLNLFIRSFFTCSHYFHITIREKISIYIVLRLPSSMCITRL